MVKRILFGTGMIVVLVGALWSDWWMQARGVGPRVHPPWPVVGLVLSGAMALLLLAAFMELEKLSAGLARLLPVSGLIGVLAMGLLPFWRQMVRVPMDSPAMLALLGLLAVLVFAEQMVRRPAPEALRNLACTFLAVFYLGVGGAGMLQIRFSFGVSVFALFLGVVKATDIAAYSTGTLCGRHKMVPSISPGKSWEGLAGGLVGAVATAMVGVWLLARLRGGPAILPPWQAAAFGVLMAVAGQFADLCESLLKRSADVKDSAAIVPGFGGVLDIIDSLLLSAPVAYLFLSAFRR